MAKQRPLDSGLTGNVPAITELSFSVTSRLLIPGYAQMDEHQFSPRLFCNKAVSLLQNNPHVPMGSFLL